MKHTCEYSGIEFEEKNKWIRVNDKVPLYKQCVLIYLREEIITEAVYRGEYEKNVHIFRIALINEDISEGITHWMNLPEPPK